MTREHSTSDTRANKTREQTALATLHANKRRSSRSTRNNSLHFVHTAATFAHTCSFNSNLFLPKLLRTSTPSQSAALKSISSSTATPFYLDFELYMILGLIALALIVTSPAFENKKVAVDPEPAKK